MKKSLFLIVFFACSNVEASTIQFSQSLTPAVINKVDAPVNVPVVPVTVPKVVPTSVPKVAEIPYAYTTTYKQTSENGQYKSIPINEAVPLPAVTTGIIPSVPIPSLPSNSGVAPVTYKVAPTTQQNRFIGRIGRLFKGNSQPYHQDNGYQYNQPIISSRISSSNIGIGIIRSRSGSGGCSSCN